MILKKVVGGKAGELFVISRFFVWFNNLFIKKKKKWFLMVLY